ncbi:helix-turn-helix transcriptional regulator [Microbispora sp. NPDC088329]|uniref:helix-turn-helix domain-containing protein n=1 Tax=Microbispora sp. NPDC088329 TaxID=3154869 RepID=UPI0034150692
MSDAKTEPLNLQVKAARLAAGFTQRRAADEFGCSQAFIHQLEDGTARILPRRLGDLVAIYGMRLVPVDAAAADELASTLIALRAQWEARRRAYEARVDSADLPAARDRAIESALSQVVQELDRVLDALGAARG